MMHPADQVPVMLVHQVAQRLGITMEEAGAFLHAGRVLSNQGPLFWLAIRNYGRQRAVAKQDHSLTASTKRQRYAWHGEALEAQQLELVLQALVQQAEQMRADFARSNQPEPTPLPEEVPSLCT